ncbi:MAG: hypothetical protein Q7V57_02945 [Actinomycetota bacterium]|nr:hypothetical protein [Actinomycetota bacterium]
MAATWDDIRKLCQRVERDALQAPDPLGRLIREWPHLPAPDPIDRVARDGATLDELSQQQYLAKVAANRAVIGPRT